MSDRQKIRRHELYCFQGKALYCNFILLAINQFLEFIVFIYIILARTPEIGQGLGRILSCGACKLTWTYDYCGLRTTTLLHDILILP